ncbi:MAG: hypothetical protein KBD16_02250 [Candidatus Pacebacteria bacterium]|nr:hypothetical protein [Candidatus Paceibacterota bacterium]
MILTRREALYEQERAQAMKRLDRCMEILHWARVRGSEASGFRDEVNRLIARFKHRSVEAELSDLEQRFQDFLTGRVAA